MTDDLLHDHPDNRVIKPGQLLPPARRIAEQHGVSPRTARRGLRLLSTLGWAKPIPRLPLHGAHARTDLSELANDGSRFGAA
jgi:DNA-binding FadR family transcriptional regulator